MISNSASIDSCALIPIVACRQRRCAPLPQRRPQLIRAAACRNPRILLCHAIERHRTRPRGPAATASGHDGARCPALARAAWARRGSASARHRRRPASAAKSASRFAGDARGHSHRWRRGWLAPSGSTHRYPRGTAPTAILPRLSSPDCYAINRHLHLRRTAGAVQVWASIPSTSS